MIPTSTQKLVILSTLLCFVSPTEQQGQTTDSNRVKVDSPVQVVRVADSLERVKDSLVEINAQKTLQLNRAANQLLVEAKKKRKTTAQPSHDNSVEVIVKLDSMVYEPNVEKYKGVYIVDMDKERQDVNFTEKQNKVDTVYLPCPSNCNTMQPKKSLFRKFFGK